jgi:hypothetical protein
MRRPGLAFSALAVLAAAAAVYAGGASSWRTFQGAWFTIKYPPGFKVASREPSRTAVNGYDGVSFLSPDGLCEFYVFSPQWSGEPKWIRMTRGETNAGQRAEAKSGRTVTWGTIRGPGGKYTRAYVDTQDHRSKTRLVFGIKYRDDRVYRRYRPSYLLFKKSLKQFAD